MRVTAELILSHLGCSPGVNQFIEKWPNGTEITKEMLDEVKKFDVLDVEWGVKYLLTPNARHHYVAKRNEARETRRKAKMEAKRRLQFYYDHRGRHVTPETLQEQFTEECKRADDDFQEAITVAFLEGVEMTDQEQK